MLTLQQRCARALQSAKSGTPTFLSVLEAETEKAKTFCGRENCTTVYDSPLQINYRDGHRQAYVIVGTAIEGSTFISCYKPTRRRK